MLCRKLHCQKGCNLVLLSYKIACGRASSGRAIEREARRLSSPLRTTVVNTVRCKYLGNASLFGGGMPAAGPRPAARASAKPFYSRHSRIRGSLTRISGGLALDLGGLAHQQESSVRACLWQGFVRQRRPCERARCPFVLLLLYG